MHTEALDTALRIFATRVRQGDTPAAEHMALTVAAILGADYTERGCAPRVSSEELAAATECAERILAQRTAEGDTEAARHAALTLALLTAKRVQRAA